MQRQAMIKNYKITIEEANAMLLIANGVAEALIEKNHYEILAYLREAKKTFRMRFKNLTKFLTECTPGASCLFSILDLPQCEKPEALTLLLACLVNATLIKEYDHGVLIKTVTNHDDQDRGYTRPSSKDSKEFYLHTDLSYVNTPPGLFMMHCLNNATQWGGRSIFCNIENVLAALSPWALSELSKPQFLFPAPEYYGRNQTIIFPILSRDDVMGEYIVRYRRDELSVLSKNGIRALAEFTQLASANLFFYDLKPCAALFINNHKILHGRQGFISKRTQQRLFNQVYFEFN